MTDDERYDWVSGDQLATRPILQNRLVSKGVYFKNYRGSFNLCAPSRASITTGLAWWNHNLFNETAIASFDWTKQWWADAWGEVGARLFNVCHMGKVINGWGKLAGNEPVPPNMMQFSFDEFYGFQNENLTAADAHLTHGSTTITSALAPFSASDVGKTIICINVAGIPASTTISAFVSASQVTLSAAFTGTTTTVGGIVVAGNTHTYNEQQKGGFAAHEETFDQDGNSLGWNYFASQYNKTNAATFNDYSTEYMRIRSLAFLDRVVNRSQSDTRYGLPFFLTISPTSGHTPFQDPPVYTPDTTNRAARMAVYGQPASQGYIRDIYDDRLAGNDQGCTPAARGISGTASNVTTTTLSDNTKTWTVNQWAGFTVTRGTAFAVVLSNTATALTVGEWLTVGSNTAANNYSASLASTPAAGAYTLVRYNPDIPKTNIGADASEWYSTNVTGSGGEYSTSPGNNIKDERSTGREMVGVDDLVEALCAYLETQVGQYSLDNTVIIYCADNGLIRGEKNEWTDKGFPPDADFRIPLIIRWTGGGVPQGVTNSFHCCTLDIYPTVMSLAGIPPSVRTRPNSDGLDFSEALRGNQAYPTNRAHLFNGNGSTNTRGVITSQYRYYHDTSPPAGLPNDMIFNWVRDPYELRNLWGTAEVTGTNTVQADLVAMANTYYGVSAVGVTAGLTYP